MQTSPIEKVGQAVEMIGVGVPSLLNPWLPRLQDEETQEDVVFRGTLQE